MTAEHDAIAPEPRRPGRPRSARAERAIHDAALELLVEQGYEGMTIEAVATRAGVGKATIYRRYDGKESLVAAALRTLNPSPSLPLPDTGSVRGDLRFLVDVLARSTLSSVLGPMIVRVASAAISNPDLQSIFLENVIAPRHAAAYAILRRGVERGELRSDLDLSLMLDLIVGPIIYRVLFGRTDIRQLPDVVPHYIDILLDGAAFSRPGSPESPSPVDTRPG